MAHLCTKAHASNSLLLLLGCRYRLNCRDLDHIYYRGANVTSTHRNMNTRTSIHTHTHTHIHTHTHTHAHTHTHTRTHTHTHAHTHTHPHARTHTHTHARAQRQGPHARTPLSSTCTGTGLSPVGINGGSERAAHRWLAWKSRANESSR